MYFKDLFGRFLVGFELFFMVFLNRELVSVIGKKDFHSKGNEIRHDIARITTNSGNIRPKVMGLLIMPPQFSK